MSFAAVASIAMCLGYNISQILSWAQRGVRVAMPEVRSDADGLLLRSSEEVQGAGGRKVGCGCCGSVTYRVLSKSAAFQIAGLDVHFT